MKKFIGLKLNSIIGAAISGKDGAATFDGTIDVTDWDIEITAKIANVTDSNSSTWEESIASGFKAWGGSLSGFLKSGESMPTTGTSGEIVLTAKSGTTWTGDCFILSIATVLNITGEDAVKVTMTFTGTGTLNTANS